MFDIEVCILNKVSTVKLLESNQHSLDTGAEADISYDRRLIRINLTGVWQLAFEDYDDFLDELVGTIIHEYLHYFFHINRISQNEELIHRLACNLQVLSLGHMIGATNGKHENIEQYEEFVHSRFKS